MISCHQALSMVAEHMFFTTAQTEFLPRHLLQPFGFRHFNIDLRGSDGNWTQEAEAKPCLSSALHCTQQHERERTSRMHHEGCHVKELSVYEQRQCAALQTVSMAWRHVLSEVSTGIACAVDGLTHVSYHNIVTIRHC